MQMDDFNNMLPIKFLIVLGKMHASVFGNVEKHIKELGYNASEFLVMYAIAANGPLTIQDIAARIDVTSGNMTYTIDKLEKRDLVKRVRCPEDRRMIYIDFTSEGQKQWEMIMVDHEQYMVEAFSSIETDTVEKTIEGMKEIGRKFGR